MNFKLLKIGLLCAVLGLASCGGGSDSGTTTGATAGGGATTGTTVAPNTGTLTVTTVPNNVVSIGASGTNFKTADATGKAVFTGLTPGAVDVHIFSADGYSATSYMGINTASITDSTVVGLSSSVVDVYVQVVNPDVSGQGFYLLVGTDRYWGSQNPATGIVFFHVYNKSAGTAVTGTVYAAQGAATSSAGNTVVGDAEVLNLGTHNFITTAVGGAAQVNLVANFAAVLPAAPTLVTLQSVTPPAGMSVIDGFFGEVYVYGASFNAPLTLPDTIGAGMVGNDWAVYASNAAGNNVWFYTGGTFAQGDSLSATASLTTPPTMAANQTGNTLTWTNTTTAHTLNVISIYDAGYVYNWGILLPSSVSSVTLPTLPTGVTAPLTGGTTYQVDIIAAKESTGATYEQLIAFFGAGGQFTGETISLTVPYTR